MEKGEEECESRCAQSRNYPDELLTHIDSRSKPCNTELGREKAAKINSFSIMIHAYHQTTAASILFQLRNSYVVRQERQKQTPLILLLDFQPFQCKYLPFLQTDPIISTFLKEKNLVAVADRIPVWKGRKTL